MQNKDVSNRRFGMCKVIFITVLSALSFVLDIAIMWGLAALLSNVIGWTWALLTVALGFALFVGIVCYVFVRTLSLGIELTESDVAGLERF